MDGLYEVEAHPFFTNRMTGVRLFHAVSLTRNRQPVVIKRHDIYLGRNKPEFLAEFCLALNTGLAQARVDHPHSCKILEFRMDIDIDRNCYSVFHVLEAMESDLGREIEERKREVTEEEMRKFMRQTSSALAFAHSKGIAHRDVKPGNIFLTKDGDYQIGDFGSFYESKATLSAQTVTGTLPYMSPQQRDLITGRTEKYDPYKGDTFALGMTSISLVTNAILREPWPLARLSERVRETVDGLNYTPDRKRLLVAMLAVEERDRPSMQEVLETVEAKDIAVDESTEGDIPGLEGIQQVFPVVYCDNVALYDLTGARLTTHTLSLNFQYDGSYIQIDNNSLICVGSDPPTTHVHLLNLTTFQFLQLPSLTTPRSVSGIAKIDSFVYVFGGWDGEEVLSSCEKSNIRSDTRWTRVRNNMTCPRSSFTPCLYTHLLYLISTNRHTDRAVESFDPSTEAFTRLAVQLPYGLEIGCRSVTFSANDEICLLTEGKQIARWKVNKDKDFKLKGMKEGCWSNQPPLLVGSKAIIASEGRVRVFSLETFTFTG